MQAFYKKNLKLFAEYYISDKENRNKVIAIRNRQSDKESHQPEEG